MEGKGDVMSTACGTPGYVGKRFDYTVHPLFPAAIQTHRGKGIILIFHRAHDIYGCSLELEISEVTGALSSVLFYFGSTSCSPAQGLWVSLSSF